MESKLFNTIFYGIFIAAILGTILWFGVVIFVGAKAYNAATDCGGLPSVVVEQENNSTKYSVECPEHGQK